MQATYGLPNVAKHYKPISDKRNIWFQNVELGLEFRQSLLS